MSVLGRMRSSQRKSHRDREKKEISTSPFSVCNLFPGVKELDNRYL